MTYDELMQMNELISVVEEQRDAARGEARVLSERQKDLVAALDRVQRELRTLQQELPALRQKESVAQENTAIVESEPESVETAADREAALARLREMRAVTAGVCYHSLE